MLALGVIALATIAGACSSDDGAADATTTTEASSATTEAPSTPAETPDEAATPTTAPDGAVVAPGAAPGELEAVGLDATADFGNGVTARLTSIESTEAEAELPGEVAGPAVRVTVEMTNGSDQPVALDNVGVILTTAGGDPMFLITHPDAVAFSGAVEPGASATGTYLFTIAPEDRADARLTVKHSADSPTAIFTGSLPNG